MTEEPQQSPESKRQHAETPKGTSAELPLPTKQEAIQLLKRLGLSYNIIDHQLCVMRRARDLAHNITNAEIDIELVKIGALVHDIGRVRNHGLEHASDGGDILRELGYPESLARIAEKHSLGGLTMEEAVEKGLPPRDYVPRTIEEKIVCLADKYTSGSKKVTVEQRFERWLIKFGENDFLLEQIRRVKAIEEEILHMIFMAE